MSEALAQCCAEHFYCYMHAHLQSLSESCFTTKFKVHVRFSKRKDTSETDPGSSSSPFLIAIWSKIIITNTRLSVLRRTERQAYKPRKDGCLMLCYRWSNESNSLQLLMCANWQTAETSHWNSSTCWVLFAFAQTTEVRGCREHWN